MRTLPSLSSWQIALPPTAPSHIGPCDQAAREDPCALPSFAPCPCLTTATLLYGRRAHAVHHAVHHAVTVLCIVQYTAPYLGHSHVALVVHLERHLLLLLWLLLLWVRPRGAAGGGGATTAAGCGGGVRDSWFGFGGDGGGGPLWGQRKYRLKNTTSSVDEHCRSQCGRRDKRKVMHQV